MIVASDTVYGTSFSITGGGALFQIGPQVNTNQQVNMAIDSVSATRLGSSEIGYLAEVKTGGDFALTRESPQYDQASQIVDEAITRISVLRGAARIIRAETLSIPTRTSWVSQPRICNPLSPPSVTPTSLMRPHDWRATRSW